MEIKNVLLTLGLLVVMGFVVHSASAQDNTFRIPENARKINENTYYLGKKRDPQSGKLVEGYMIVEHGKSGQAKPDHAGGPKNGGGTSSCYGFLARGAKWKTTEPWIMNTSNTRGLDGSTVFNIVGNSIQKWEDKAGTEILGSGSTTTNQLVADTSGSPDALNEVYFADIQGTSAIGVTTVWGVFGGPPSGRQLVEWDQVYDDVTFDWSADPVNGIAGKMDFENIATHELGHSVGMDDLYDGSCTDETMYGYAGTGETNKRTLNAGDIEGISSLYK